MVRTRELLSVVAPLLLLEALGFLLHHQKLFQLAIAIRDILLFFAIILTKIFERLLHLMANPP